MAYVTETCSLFNLLFTKDLNGRFCFVTKMSEELPTDYDIIVVGTGLVESIVAAAAARVGKQVLHLDPRDYYGSYWATFSFNALQEFLEKEKQDFSRTILNEESRLSLKTIPNSLSNIVEQWNENSQFTENNKSDNEERNLPLQKQWTRCKFAELSRIFNIDLSPKVLYSQGEMVNLLITSGICHYAEFKNVSKVLSFNQETNSVIQVPCSRADVFSSPDLSVLEKHSLMKMIKLCHKYEEHPEEFTECEATTFGEFLASRQIQGKVRHVLDSVAVAAESTQFSTAVNSIKKFVNSVGRYGNTPFLWTLYGSGELPQSFCRLCAVFGGIYCLVRKVDSILIGDNHQAVAVISQNQTLNASYFVVEDSLIPNQRITGGTSRAILITDRGLSNENHVTLLNFPQVNGRQPVHIIEVPSSANASPEGLYVVHLTTAQTNTAVEDLSHVINILFNSANEICEKPNILWSVHFNLPVYDSGNRGLPSNVFVGSGPDCELDFDNYVQRAKEIFHSIYPEEEFLPRVPDPEDVVLEEPKDNENS